ncbi:uncharacterized protein B0T15DRAFT_521658 [Chaetomium strumarium]|uniref:Uncharacterized protein n=1 Tax=Chaetomium strumarium TaxID=1170767 RepID=A0AAJ0H459_9PEZI|nr:hypothetical protein B0T15DRAFT_521658 [Chaetomium strumarium]
MSSKTEDCRIECSPASSFFPFPAFPFVLFLSKKLPFSYFIFSDSFSVSLFVSGVCIKPYFFGAFLYSRRGGGFFVQASHSILDNLD